LSDSAPSTNLQFDRAEFKGETAPLACASCATPIQSTYYQVGDAITCERCRRSQEWDATHGSAVVRLLKASLFGLLAAALGAGLYYAVRALTGYEFGLIAIVVGFMVGGAVRAGSGHRGGVPYQLLAMALTYASIVCAYIPEILAGLREQAATEPSGGPLLAVITVIVAVGLAFVAPFLMGFENIIGVIIIAIGLYEAWKINRKPDRTVTGPFRIEAAANAPIPTAVP
jgi:hypothetical protein